MGKQARLHTLANGQGAPPSGDAMAFPPVAQRECARVVAQVQAMSANLQSYLSGILVGQGVDFETHDVRLDFGDPSQNRPATYTVTPKTIGPSA